jgi:hypothetical protein
MLSYYNKTKERINQRKMKKITMNYNLLLMLCILFIFILKIRA